MPSADPGGEVTSPIEETLIRFCLVQEDSLCAGRAGFFRRDVSGGGRGV